MILTDREIQAAIQHAQIVIEPNPGLTAYSSTSIDLSLSRFIRQWRPVEVKGVDQVVCPATQGYNFGDFSRAYSDLRELDGQGFILEPGLFILGWTEEVVKLPTSARIAARVEGKSSLARLGIGIHITAPTIHAGFEGPIQLEICNHGLLRVKVIPGMPVCQLIFEQTLGVPEKGYSGQFLHQTKK